jgi:hypothetical protein
MNPIQPIAWFKNHTTEWYKPEKEIDLTEYDYIELLQRGYYDTFICWHDSTGKVNGRLFYGHWNSGYIPNNQKTKIIYQLF